MRVAVAASSRAWTQCNGRPVTHPHGYHGQKDAIVKRLHRIGGQVRGIEKMEGKAEELLEAVHRFAKTR